MRRLLMLIIALAALIFAPLPSVNAAGFLLLAKPSCSATFALDGTPVQTNYGSSTSTPTIVLPTTTGSSDLIGISIYYNQTGNSVTGVSGGV
jgi:hypothetical protein